MNTQKTDIIRTIRAKLRRFSDKALARLAVSNEAALASDTARNLVQPHRSEDPCEMVEQAHQLHQSTDELLRRTVVYAVERGVSWTDIGEALAITRQSASNRYTPHREQWQQGLIEPVARDTRSITTVNLPDPELANPEALIERLNSWIGKGDIASGLPPANSTATANEVLWRTDALTTMRGIDGDLPDDLREDYETRKATALDDHPGQPTTPQNTEE